MLGLVRFDLSFQMMYQMLRTNGVFDVGELVGCLPDDDAPYLVRLNAMGGLLTAMLEEITKRFVETGTAEAYWDLAADFLRKNLPLQVLSKSLASMQVVPADNPILVTMAQVLHWKGWGGDGSVLVATFGSDLDALLRNCIHFISDAHATHFTGLMSQMTGPMMEITVRVMTAFYAGDDGPVH
jgi:hypothetical protein